jgi:hypothetical protein
MTSSRKTLNLRKWLEQVQETLPEEISCSECFDLISTYVDLEMDEEPAQQRLPLVHQHLKQCQVCRDEYELLHDLALGEKEGAVPSIEELRRRIQGGLE